MANAFSNAVMNRCFIAALVLLLIFVVNVCYHWFTIMQPLQLPKVIGRRCAWTKLNLTRTSNISLTPPWFSLLADYNTTVMLNRNLYVFPRLQNISSYRLGNRLFNYAATFGIAWRNEQIPVWPPCLKSFKQYDLAEFFNLRIPEDKDNAIITVKLILCWNDNCNIFIHYDSNLRETCSMFCYVMCVVNALT